MRGRINVKRIHQILPRTRHIYQNHLLSYTHHTKMVTKGKKKRCVVEKAKSMALTCNFPTYLWMEAINTIISLSNQSPNKANKRINLKEKYLGMPLWVDHLKIFSSFAYVYVPQNQPIKLDYWTIICMLVGLDSTTKGYILSINPWIRKMVISKDVVMDELIQELCNKSYDLNMLNNVTWQYHHLLKKWLH